MEKSTVIELLRAAKKAHIQWIVRAQALTKGLPVEQSAIPVDCTQCKFGLWLYSEGQELASISGLNDMQEIEKTHFELHAVYMDIFSIYFPDAKKSFLKKIFTRKHKVNSKQQDLAQEHFEKLQKISEELTSLINRLERRLLAMAAEKFSGN